MLQDDGDDELTRALALNACYNFYSIATDEDYKNQAEDDEDEDIVRIKKCLEIYRHQHYDFRLK